MARAEGRRTENNGAPRINAPVDIYRAFVFPNRVREQRRRLGYSKLLRLASQIPDIPYIRLSKIERGEVVPRAEELRRIATILGISATELLIDVDRPGFDIATWAEPFVETVPADLAEERFAVLLGAALRVRRAGDPSVTIATIERDHGIAPVNLSRIENAHKPFGRWNGATQAAILAILGVPNQSELRALVDAWFEEGALDEALAAIAGPEQRLARSRERIAEVRSALAAPMPRTAREPAPAPVGPAPVRLIPVFGSPLGDGLIADTPNGETVEPPHAAGPRAFGLKLHRATLGAGLPAHSTVIVDPDRYPTPGGLAALREDAGWRLLSVGSTREGWMIGYGMHPEREIPLDDVEPARLAAVVGAIFP